MFLMLNLKPLIPIITRNQVGDAPTITRNQVGDVSNVNFSTPDALTITSNQQLTFRC